MLVDNQNTDLSIYIKKKLKWNNMFFLLTTMATYILSQILPNEMVDIIMEKTHKLNLKRVHSEFNDLVSQRKSELNSESTPMICPMPDDDLMEFQFHDPFVENDPNHILYDVYIPYYVEPRDAYDYVNNNHIYVLE